MDIPSNYAKVTGQILYGPTNSDLSWFLSQESVRADYWRVRDPELLRTFYRDLTLYLRNPVEKSVFRFACLFLLVAEMEPFLETAVINPLAEHCAQRARTELNKVKMHGGHRGDISKAIRLIERRINEVCNHALDAQRQRATSKSIFGSFDNQGTGTPLFSNLDHPRGRLPSVVPRYAAPIAAPNWHKNDDQYRNPSPANDKQKSSGFQQPQRWPTRSPIPGNSFQAPTLEPSTQLTNTLNEYTTTNPSSVLQNLDLSSVQEFRPARSNKSDLVTATIAIESEAYGLNIADAIDGKNRSRSPSKDPSLYRNPQAGAGSGLRFAASSTNLEGIASGLQSIANQNDANSTLLENSRSASAQHSPIPQVLVSAPVPSINTQPANQSLDPTIAGMGSRSQSPSNVPGLYRHTVQDTMRRTSSSAPLLRVPHSPSNTSAGDGLAHLRSDSVQSLPTSQTPLCTATTLGQNTSSNDNTQGNSNGNSDRNVCSISKNGTRTVPATNETLLNVPSTMSSGTSDRTHSKIPENILPGSRSASPSRDPNLYNQPQIWTAEIRRSVSNIDVTHGHRSSDSQASSTIGQTGVHRSGSAANLSLPEIRTPSKTASHAQLAHGSFAVGSAHPRLRPSVSLSNFLGVQAGFGISGTQGRTPPQSASSSRAATPSPFRRSALPEDSGIAPQSLYGRDDNTARSRFSTSDIEVSGSDIFGGFTTHRPQSSPVGLSFGLGFPTRSDTATPSPSNTRSTAMNPGVSGGFSSLRPLSRGSFLNMEDLGASISRTPSRTESRFFPGFKQAANNDESEDDETSYEGKGKGRAV